MPVLFIERNGSEWRSQATPEFERYRRKTGQDEQD
jgi:hypothetical protein